MDLDMRYATFIIPIITNTNMQVITRPTPIFVNLCFLALLIIPILVLLSGITIANAGSLNCREEFYNSYLSQPDPTIAKVCKKKWGYYYRMEMKQYREYDILLSKKF
jgi:hypothetical protein